MNIRKISKEQLKYAAIVIISAIGLSILLLFLGEYIKEQNITWDKILITNIQDIGRILFPPSLMERIIIFIIIVSVCSFVYWYRWKLKKSKKATIKF